VPAERAVAFAPGRVNVIGEHTDYNGGLALPFAISQGIVVDAHANADSRVSAHAVDLDEKDAFALSDRARVEGWRAFVRGIVAELSDTGIVLPGAALQIGGDLPRGAGLSSSAALEVALCLALLELSGVNVGPVEALPARGREQAREVAPGAVAPGELAREVAPGERTREVAPRDQTRETARDGRVSEVARMDVARLCARVENDWVGAQTGLLDQLASLFGRRDSALLIDFRTLAIEPVPLRLGDWRLIVLDSGERHTHARDDSGERYSNAGGGSDERHSNASGDYNERRSECARACELLGVATLSEASADAVERLPDPLRARARHVLSENDRVRAAVDALHGDDMPALARLLDASHASLRDDYEISTPAVEAAVARLHDAGAAGARIVGGGFGGSVLALFAPGIDPPGDALPVSPGPGAHLREA
jgi:galactokinase